MADGVWTGREGASHRYTTARAVMGDRLGLGSAGYSAPTTPSTSSLAYLRNQVTAADTGDFEGRAIVLHALAAVGQGDFALANHL